jgi:ammonium transporter, Amt family
MKIFAFPVIPSIAGMQAEIVSLHDELIRLTSEFKELQAAHSHRKLTEYDEGEVAIILASTSLVIFMTLPGIALFYSGGVKIKHVLTTFAQTMSIVAVITCLWMIFGYSLAFAPSNGELRSASVFGDTSKFWLHGMRIDSRHVSAPHIPESTYCLFQLTNAILACALIVGPFSCRAKYLPLLTFMGIWLLLVYCPLVHMLHHPEGFLNKAGVLDFAGGLTVHVAPGIAAFVCAKLIGNRLDTEERFESRNMLLSVWGACFLWIGWFGFNIGSSIVDGDPLLPPPSLLSPH